jgi:predicted branched-subunit amino acid permease
MAFRIDRIGAFGSKQAAFRGGVRLSLGVPVLALGASYLGFGALVRESGFSLWQGLFSSATTFALPGQVLLVELYAVGATLAVMAVAVGLSSMRLLPMTVSLLPQLRYDGLPRWRLFLTAHFIAVTGWAVTMKVAPRLPPEERLAFFTGLTSTLWVTVILCTAIGYYLPDALPHRVTLALLFLNPLYFLLIFMSDLKQRSRALALLFGALLGPPLFLVEADWSLLFAGFLGGTAAYLLGLRRR